MSTNKSFNYPDNELYQFVQEELYKRGITAYSIGEIAYEMQHDYLPDYEISDFTEQFSEVLKKREVLNLLAFAFELDNLANKRMFSEPIQNIIENDAGFWQIDEILASSLAQLFGMLAITNYGYLDKNKVGIARQLDEEDSITVFSDDIVSALASAVIGRCGHGSKLELDEQANDIYKEDFNYDAHNEETSNSTVSHNNWNLNKFGNELQEHLLNSRDIEDNMEELIDHKYYVDMSVISPDLDSSWLLLIRFSDNQFNFVDATAIDLEDLLEYIWSKTGANGAQANISEMIVNLLRENDLLPDISKSTDSDIDDEIKTNYDKYNDDTPSLILQLLRSRKDLPHE